MHQTRVAIYCRVSTDRQALTKDGSIDTQRERLLKNIEVENLEKEEGHEWVLAGEYTDAGQSGKSLDRPELERLRADIESGLIDVVLVTKLDRITRSVLDFYELKQAFEQHNVAFRSLDEKFDTTSAMGEALLSIIIVFAQLERRITAERTREHMAARAVKGLFGGGRPWGYKLNPEHKGELLIDEVEAETIRGIFRQYLEEKSLHSLQRWMVTYDVRRPEYESRRNRKGGGTVPTVGGLKGLLSNPIYIGKLRFKGEIFEGVHEAIFKTDEDLDLWNKVQEKLAKRSPKSEDQAPRLPLKEDPHHVYSLKGMLFCGQCGSALTPSSGTSGAGELRFYYTCTKRQKHGKKGCDTPSIPAEAIEDAILARIRECTVDKALIKSLIAKADDGRHQKLERMKAVEQQAKERLKEVEKELAPLVQTVKTGGLEGLRSIREEMERLEKLRATLEVDLQAAVDQRRLLEMDQLSDDVIMARYEGLKDVLDRADGWELADLLPTIIKSIDWYPDEQGGRGGRYKMLLKPNPLISNELSPERDPGEGIGSYDCVKWLPLEHAVRNVLFMPTPSFVAAIESGSRLSRL